MCSCALIQNKCRYYKCAAVQSSITNVTTISVQLCTHPNKCYYYKAVFTPQLWDRNRSGTQPGARVHTCSTASSRSGTSRPPRDVIAVERFRNGSGWLCGVNAQPDAFRSLLASTCVIMTNSQYILPKSVYPAKNPHTLVDRLGPTRFRHSLRNIWHVHVSNPDAIRKFPIFVIPKSLDTIFT